MKKYYIALSIFLLLAMSGPAGAYSINYSKTTVGNDFFSPYAGVVTETFNAGTAGSFLGLDQAWNWTGNGGVQQGDVSGVASAPFGALTKDTTKYMSVPTNLSSIPQSVTVALGGTYNYFGLWWGSVDTYNTLSFYKGGIQVESFGGTVITTPNAANGNQTAPTTNLYVNFLGLPDFDSFVMTSTSFAFEADNIAVGVVPEPLTLILLGSGLLGLFGLRRKLS